MESSCIMDHAVSVLLSFSWRKRRKPIAPRSFHAKPDFPLVLALVLFEELRGFRVGRRRGIWVAEQGLDGAQDAWNPVHGRPLVLQDVEAYGAVGIDIRMVLRDRRDAIPSESLEQGRSGRAFGLEGVGGAIVVSAPFL